MVAKRCTVRCTFRRIASLTVSCSSCECLHVTSFSPFFCCFNITLSLACVQSYGGGAPGTPHSAPSPGSLASQDDLYQRDVGSPGGHSWGGRVPPSPVGTPGPVSEEPVLCTHTVDIYGSVCVCASCVLSSPVLRIHIHRESDPDPICFNVTQHLNMRYRYLSFG